MKTPSFNCGGLFSSVSVRRRSVVGSLRRIKRISNNPHVHPSSSAHFPYFSDTNSSKKLTPAGVGAVRGGTVIREKYGL